MLNAGSRDLLYTQTKISFIRLIDMCNSISRHLSLTACPAPDSRALRAAFDKATDICRGDFTSFESRLSLSSQERIDGHMRRRLDEGVQSAEKKALKNMKAEIALVRWSTWKAAVKRNGVFERRNIESVPCLDYPAWP